MAEDWEGMTYDEWTDDEQRRWDSVNDAVPENLRDDIMLQIYYDVAFNTPRDEISGDQRAAVMHEMFLYMDREYGIDFESMFDWDDWRDWYDAA